jgi:hypothetical protein
VGQPHVEGPLVATRFELTSIGQNRLSLGKAPTGIRIILKKLKEKKWVFDDYMESWL